MTLLLTPELIEEVNKFLDSEAEQEAATHLGSKLYKTFTHEKGGRISTQVRNLEQITVTATRFADIEDFVKQQMGRNTGAYQEWRQVGKDILEHLSTLRKKADNLSTDEGQRLLLRLHLARGWIHSVVNAYLYKKALTEMGSCHAEH